MSKKPGFSLLLVFLLTGIEGICQNNDAGLWISGNLEKRFTQAMSMSFSQELRMDENITEAGTVFSDLGFEYRLNKQFRIAAHYRFVNYRRLDNSYKTRNRFYADLSYRIKISPVIFIFRERIQSETGLPDLQEGISPKYYSRTKATLKLELKRKIVPYAYAEWFHPILSPASGFIDKTRVCAGFEYQVTPGQMVDLNYLVQFKPAMKGNDFVIGIGYFFTF